MKLTMRLIPCALLVLAFAARGDDSTGGGQVLSSNIHAMVTVLSCDTNTIVSVPWMFYTPDGASTTNLPVDHLVRPTNLTLGDHVLAHLPNPKDPKDETFAAWRLTKTDEPIPGCTSPSADSDYCWKWEPVVTAKQTVDRLETDGNGQYRTDVWVPDGIAVQTECRGYGVWLLRQHPVNADGSAKPFYLYGQWATGEAKVTLKEGTDALPVCTMLANPNCLQSTDVNTLGWSNVGATDTLIITTDAKTTLYCTYKDGKWGYSTQTKVKKNGINVIKTTRVDAPTVPAGTGFWYVRRSSGDVSFTWADSTSAAD